MEERKSHIGDWLEKLQQESWHLELLVSGFSIFLLMEANGILIEGFRFINLHMSLNSNIDGMVRSFLGTSILATWVLTLNLIVHVFLRGFWIGAVGLRSVQDKIDIDALGYSDFFTKKLKERVPSLDTMLEKLDTLASVIFSFTFLIVFMFFSLFLYVATLSFFTYLVNVGLELLPEGSTIEKTLEIVAIVIIFFFLFLGIIYAVDTLSLGFFKKYQKLSKIYFPIYKTIGKITMASVYRSIYYSLISRFSKNKIRIALCVYILLFFYIPFMKYDQYIFYPDNGGDIKLWSNEYDDLRPDDTFIQRASIPSQVVKGSFLPLFIRYSVRDNEVLSTFCKDFIPKKQDGFNSGISIGKEGVKMGDAFVNENEPQKALDCLSSFYSVMVDSIALQSEFYFYIHHNNQEKGVSTMIEIDTLAKGKHEIFIKRKKLNKEEEIVDEDYTKIIFWKE